MLVNAVQCKKKRSGRFFLKTGVATFSFNTFKNTCRLVKFWKNDAWYSYNGTLWPLVSASCGSGTVLISLYYIRHPYGHSEWV